MIAKFTTKINQECLWRVSDTATWLTRGNQWRQKAKRQTLTRPKTRPRCFPYIECAAPFPGPYRLFCDTRETKGAIRTRMSVDNKRHEFIVMLQEDRH